MHRYHQIVRALAAVIALASIAAPFCSAAQVPPGAQVRPDTRVRPGDQVWPGRSGAPRPLPVFSTFSATYLGGSGEDGYRDVGILREPAGTILVAGSTRSPDFPATAGAWCTTHSGGSDVFVARFDEGFTTLLAATLFGRAGDDGPWPGVSVAEDAFGRIYVSGTTTSADLPVTVGAFDPTCNGGVDLFVAAFSHGLDSLLACTYLGGAADDRGSRLVLGGGDDLYLGGTTPSADFPTTPGAFCRSLSGGSDAYVARLTRDLRTLLASTYLGGTNDEYGMDVLWDPRGFVCLTGLTNTRGFPTTPGAYDRQINSSVWDVDAFVSVLSPGLSTLQASTFLGGSGTDFPYALAVGTAGDIFVTGHTQSTNYPTTPSAYDRTYNSPPGDFDDVLVSRLRPDLTGLVASTYLGGSAWDWGITIACDGRGHVFVGGETRSSDFPTTPGAFAGTIHGDPATTRDGCISRLDEDLTTLEASTFLGGIADDVAGRIVAEPAGNILVSGGTGSDDFPVSPGAYDTDFGGGGNRWGGDVFAACLDSLLAGQDPTSAANDAAGPARNPRLEVLPNPVGPMTSIRLTLERRSRVALELFAPQGRRIAMLAEGTMGPGICAIAWNRRDGMGRDLVPGVYWVRLSLDGSPEAVRSLVVPGRWFHRAE